MNKAFLKEFLDEEIYVIEENPSASLSPKDEANPKIDEEKKLTQVHEPQESYESQGLSYKGGNDKGIAILVHSKYETFINETNEQFLLKVLSAVDLSIEDVAIINIETQLQLSIEQLRESGFNVCLIFGELSVAREHNRYEVIKNAGLTLLNCDSLTDISGNIALKKSLWTSLKSLFSKD